MSPSPFPVPAPAPAPASTAAPLQVAVIGGGPAGLMAAEVLLAGGAQVTLFDAMPSVGRKFLLAGKGGLNLTHSEPLPEFIGRFRERAPQVAAWLEAFGPQALRDWAEGLGISTFVGTSGRVFPREMKAAPLLRAWLHRLRGQGLRLQSRHRWQGWAVAPLAPHCEGQPTAAGAPAHARGTLARAQQLRFDTPDGPVQHEADAVLLALGGGSWPQLGSDGAWVPWLGERGIDVAPLQPANCGFDVGWSDYFAQRFAGVPLKSVRLRIEGDAPGAPLFDRQGEFVVTAGGIEGSLVYAASALIRDRIARDGTAEVLLDLVPGRSEQRLVEALGRGRGARSLPNHLREHAGLDGVKAALLRERWRADELARLLHDQPGELARSIKAFPLTLTAARPLAEAISCAGGVRLEALDRGLMLRRLPGVFCAGEMLDWEAPTGGYLLTACFASGVVAARGVQAWAAGMRSA